MRATTTASASGAGTSHDAAPLSPPAFVDALRGELSYLRASRTVWLSLGVWAACVVLFAYLVSYLTTVGGQWYTPEQQAMFVNAMLPGGTGYYVLASLPMYGAPQFAILGAILGAGGYVGGTMRTVAARFSNRSVLMAARLVGLTMVAAAAALFTLLASLISSLGVAAASANPVAYPPLTDLGLAFLIVWLVAMTFLSLGFGVGTLTRRIMAAALLVLVWILAVESLLVSMLTPVFSPLATLQGYLPVGATSSLAAAVVPAGQQTVPPMLAATGPGTALVVLAVWACLASGIALRTFRRRDLA